MRLGLLTASVTAGVLVMACGKGEVLGPPADPTEMSVGQPSVSLPVGAAITVPVTFKDATGKVLSTNGDHLAQCTIQTSSNGVVTAGLGPNGVTLTGVTEGDAVVTVRFNATVSATITVHVKPPTPIISAPTPPTWVRGTNGFITFSAIGIRPDDMHVLVNGEAREDWEDLGNGQMRVEVFIEETADATGPLRISVRNLPDGEVSNVLEVPLTYPIPTATVTPTSAPAGSPGVVLTINAPPGLDEPFTLYPVTKVRFAGTEIPATYINHKQMTATIPAGLLTTAGTFNITLENPAPGGGASAPQPFTVTAAGTIATFDFRNYEGVVNWVATAMGNAPFTQVPVVNGVVQFPVTAPTASLAIVTSTGNPTALRSGPTPANVVTYQLTILSMTREEMTAAPNLMAFPHGTTPLAGTVTGVGAGELALLLWGNGEAAANAAQPGFSITNSTTGTHRLVGYRRGAGALSAGDRVFVRASQASAAGISVDFTGGESAPVATAMASLSGLIAGDQAFAAVGYITEPTCEGTLWYSTPASSSFLITGIPGALQGSNDVHLFRTLILNGNHTLQQTFYNKLLIGFAATRPVPLATPTVSTVTTTPYLIRQAVVNLGNYEAGTFFYSTVSMTATKGFLGAATGTIRAPDLSGVSGWNAAYAPPASPAWTFGASSYVATIQPCANGTSATTVSLSGSTP